ncbi:MAG: type VI secretion system contractile sheath domain-containing protein [Myxococcota bacterium]
MAAEEAANQPVFRVLAVAALSGDSASKHEVLAVDKDRLDESIARVAPSLSFRIAAPAGVGDPEIDVALRFENWRDLTPIGVAEQIPVLRGLLEARSLAERRQKGEIEADALGEGLRTLLPSGLAEALLAREASEGAPPKGAAAEAQASPPAGGGESSGSGGLDSILDMVETTPARPQAGAASVAGRIAGAVASGNRRRKAGAAAKGLVADIDRLAGLLLDAVLHEPAFRELESAWRGLRFLVQRTDFREPIELHVVSALVDDAPEALRAAGADEDYDVVATGFEIDSSPRDHERAQAIAEAGAEIQTPVLLGLAPGFFELESWSELEKARAPFATFEEGRYAVWRSLRGDERARFAVLLANRVALRAPFGRDGERARDIHYEERDSAGLFGAAAWAIASVLVRAYARTGATVQIAGTRHGLVSDLPLLEVGAQKPAPVEGAFGNERREDLEKIGVSVLGAYQRDVAFAGALRTFRQADRYPDEEATADSAQQVTLAYQLFATRFVKFLGRTLPELIGAGSRDAAVEALRTRVVGFLTTPSVQCPPDHVGIGMEDNADDASLTDVTLRVQPELMIAGRPVNVMLGFSVRL